MKRIAGKLKKPLLFALAMAPIGAVAGYFTILYQLDFMGDDMIRDAVAQLGSVEALMAVYIVQSVGYALFCGFAGYLLGEKLGLLRPLRLEKSALLITWVFLWQAASCSAWTTGPLGPGFRGCGKLQI